MRDINYLLNSYSGKLPPPLIPLIYLANTWILVIIQNKEKTFPPWTSGGGGVVPARYGRCGPLAQYCSSSGPLKPSTTSTCSSLGLGDPLPYFNRVLRRATRLEEICRGTVFHPVSRESPSPSLSPLIPAFP